MNGFLCRLSSESAESSENVSKSSVSDIVEQMGGSDVKSKLFGWGCLAEETLAYLIACLFLV